MHIIAKYIFNIHKNFQFNIYFYFIAIARRTYKTFSYSKDYKDSVNNFLHSFLVQYTMDTLQQVLRREVVATPHCDFSQTTFLGNRRLPIDYM